MDSSLQVDGRSDLPIPYLEHGHGEGDKYINGMPPNSLDQENHTAQRRPQVKRFRGLRLPTIFLSIALAIALILAVIAAGIAGRLASERERDTECVEIKSPFRSSEETNGSNTRCAAQTTVLPSPQTVSSTSSSSSIISSYVALRSLYRMLQEIY